MIILTGITVAAQEPAFRVTSAPPTPEADYQAGEKGIWDFGLGYTRVWLKDYEKASLNGVGGALLYKNTLGARIGYTLSPINGGAYFGKISGYSIQTYSVGLGLSLGARILGTSARNNLIVFGGTMYSYIADRNTAPLSTDFNTHMGGFSVGVKGQLAPTRNIQFIPFYLYVGIGGRYEAAVDLGMLGTLEQSGSLDYHDAHLFGLDFNIYGITARMVADLFRKDAGSFTVAVEVGSLISAIRRTS